MRTVRIFLATVTITTSLLTLAGCSPAAAPRPAPSATVATTPIRTAPVTFAAIGDSITATTFEGEDRAWMSWVPTATTAATIFVPGGYAVPGRSTADMLAGTTPLHADVLVIEGAVNDVDLKYAPVDILDRLRQIVGRASIPRVIVAAIPPNDRYPLLALVYNAALRNYAADQGWTFIDPWTQFRNPDGTYIAGAHWDDLHPVHETAVVAGLILRAAISIVGQTPIPARADRAF